MCKYCGTKNHRKIYENHNGSIPSDVDGRTYDIHHVDGNHSNNEPTNLIAVSIQEHYDIHHEQKDYGACLKLLTRMQVSPKDRSELARKQQLAKSADGTHNFLGGEVSRKTAQERIKSGELQRVSRETQLRKSQNGTHPFLRKNRDWYIPHQLLLGKTGLDHPKSDRKTYSLQHIETEIIYTGTRKELIQKCNLSDMSMSRLIRGIYKVQRNWKLI